MSVSLVRKISGEVSRHGPRSYFLFKDGEPFMHKDIIEMIRVIKESHKGNKIYISTNGHLLNSELQDAMISLKVDNINFSVDNASPEGYRKIRGADLACVEENVNKLMEMKRSRKSPYPHIAIHFVRHKNNEHEVESFKKKWSGKDLTLKFMYFNTWTGHFPDEAVINKGKRYPCFSLWMFPSINWDGKVSICCVDWNENEIIGDLNKDSFKDIWASEKIRLYRKYHLDGQYGKIPICQRCNVWASRPEFIINPKNDRSE